MKKVFSNWKTTSAGIITIAGGVTLYLHDKTQFLPALTAALAGVGLLFAHDASNAKASSTDPDNDGDDDTAHPSETGEK